MTYGQSRAVEQTAEPASARPTARPPQWDSFGEMPAWAKELLDNAGVQDTVVQVPFTGQAGAPSAPKKITWTAPAIANPVQRARMNDPMDLTFKEHTQTEETPWKPSVSDAEIERTADRVYRVIEERLRRELRRCGR